MPNHHVDEAITDILNVCAHEAGWDGRQAAAANPASLVLATALAVEASALGLVPEVSLSAQGNASLSFARGGCSAYVQVYPDGIAAGYVKGVGIEWDGEALVDGHDNRLRFIIHLVASLGPAPARTATSARVRPLDWKAEGEPTSAIFHADSVLGRYSAWESGGRGGLSIPGDPLSTWTGPDVRAAKAAAQADFERRIRSALAET